GLTKNIAEKGAVSDNIKSGLYYNPLMLGPYGHMYYFDLHPYVGFFVYKTALLFNRHIALREGVALTPIFLVIIAVAVFLFFMYLENIKAVPAFVGLMFFLSAPIFFQRSFFGWYDTDPYNVIFPALVIFILFAFFRTAKKTVIHAAFAGVATGIYAMFWSGWIFMPVAVILSMLAVLLRVSVQGKAHHRQGEILFNLAVYVSTVVICVILLRGPGGLFFSLNDTFLRLSKFATHKISLWPDAFLTVGELRKVSLRKIFILAGGRIFFLVSVAQIIFMASRKTKGGAGYWQKGFVLFFFTTLSFLLALRAERFTILLVTPLAVGFVFFIDNIYARILNLKLRSLRVLAAPALLFLAVIPFNSGREMALERQPIIYNSAWDRVMTEIKADTPKNSIIDTWWSPGHFITSMARRRVLFDGATLENEVGYWISKVFLSQDEAYAAGILRMLNSSGNRAVEFLLGKKFPLSKAIEIIDSVVIMSKNEVADFLKKYLADDEIKRFLLLTHGKPLPGYLFVYNDLVEKTLALCFMGNWDFKKAEDFRGLQEKNPALASKFIKEEAQNSLVRLLWGISGGPLYYSAPSYETARKNDVLYFANGLWINTLTKECGFLNAKNPLKGKIKSLIYTNGAELKEKNLSEAPSKLSVLLVETKERSFVVMADTRLARNLLFRLYYFKGIGLKFFKPFIDESDPATDTEIGVYKIIYPLASDLTDQSAANQEN
ncbi:MAG: hypothetical protein JW994_06295, partial [Candidatus Omnitrophica bacterium]|nr:hypothetical protein [Candidatus Omnitrophota bacterium]